MPLRAERLTVETLTELSAIYSVSETRRWCWEKYKDEEGKIKSYRTNQHILHIDPLTSVFRSLVDFMRGNLPRRFLLGVKGAGKTFNVLLALNKVVRENYTGVKPCYISFDVKDKIVYVKKPYSYATPEQWREGGVEPVEFDDFDRYIDWANFIVFDEIHYLMEHLIETGKSVKPFLDLLEKVLAKNCKVLLISENILMTYAEQLQDSRLNEFCLRFGLFPTVDCGEDFAGKPEYDVLAFREVTGFTREQLTLIDKVYEFEISTGIIDFLTVSGITARAFFKLMKRVNWVLNNKTLSNLVGEDLSWKLCFYEEQKLDFSERKELADIISDFVQGWCKK